MRKTYFKTVSLAETRDNVILMGSLKYSELKKTYKYYLVTFDEAGYLKEIVCYINNKPETIATVIIY